MIGGKGESEEMIWLGEKVDKRVGHSPLPLIKPLTSSPLPLLSYPFPRSLYV
jgi:hypothetical protein